MRATEMEKSRHSEQRGAILLALHQEYSREMTSTRSLLRALDLLGYPLTGDGLQFHLSLLSDLGYVQIWRARNTPMWRPDRENSLRPDMILFARLMPKGLSLIDGAIPPDPEVTF